MVLSHKVQYRVVYQVLFKKVAETSPENTDFSSSINSSVFQRSSAIVDFYLFYDGPVDM